MRLNVRNLYVGKNSFARGFFIEQNIICHDRSGFFFHESKLLMIKRYWSGMERLLHQRFLVSDYVTFLRNLPHVRKPYTTTFYGLIQCFYFDPTNDHMADRYVFFVEVYFFDDFWILIAWFATSSESEMRRVNLEMPMESDRDMIRM